MMDDDSNEFLRGAIAAIGDDKTSGASEILPRVVGVLRRVVTIEPAGRLRVAAALCRAQPSMAPVWNACVAALAGSDALDRFAQRAERATRTIARLASDLIVLGRDEASIVIRTVSASGTVAAAIERIATRHLVRVICGEGRPHYEGRAMAARLASHGIDATVCVDGATTAALGASDVVLLGADAVAPRWFINKCGSRGLAAAAMLAGAPAYVLAGRDKFVPQALADVLPLAGGPTAEVWQAPADGVHVINSYFEIVPRDLVGALVTDAGVLAPTSANEVDEEHFSQLKSLMDEVLAIP